jgi:hypothetical protein
MSDLSEADQLLYANLFCAYAKATDEYGNRDAAMCLAALVSTIVDVELLSGRGYNKEGFLKTVSKIYDYRLANHLDEYINRNEMN